MWELLSLWRYDSEEYDRVVANKPGATWSKLNDVDTTTNTTNNTTTNTTNTTNATTEEAVTTTESTNTSTEKEPTLYSMSHPEFINLYNQWHAQLGSTFIGGLQSSEYMHTRITLVLLTRIVRHFPTKSKLGEKFGTVLEPLHSDENPMQDIKLMALAYKSQLSTIQWKEEDTNVTKARDEKKREDRERKKINLQNMNKEIIDDVRNYDKRVKPASGPKRTLKFTPADPSRARAIDPRSRPPNKAERDETKNINETTATQRRWQPISNNTNNNAVSSSTSDKRGYSPDRGGGADHGGGDSKRHRQSRQTNVSTDPRRTRRR